MNLFTMYILDQSRALCSSMGFTVVGTSWCYFFSDTTLTYDMAKVGKRVTEIVALNKIFYCQLNR